MWASAERVLVNVLAAMIAVCLFLAMVIMAGYLFVAGTALKECRQMPGKSISECLGSGIK